MTFEGGSGSGRINRNFSIHIESVEWISKEAEEAEVIVSDGHFPVAHSRNPARSWLVKC